MIVTTIILGLVLLMIVLPGVVGIYIVQPLEMERQCKEIVVQHFLTGGTQIDPEVVKNCIYNNINHPTNNHGTINELGYVKNISRNRLEFVKADHFREKIPATSNEGTKTIAGHISPTTEEITMNGYKDLSILQTLFKKEAKATTLVEDGLIETHPENITREWPVVKTVRRKRDEPETVDSTSSSSSSTSESSNTKNERDRRKPRTIFYRMRKYWIRIWRKIELRYYYLYFKLIVHFSS